MPLEPPRNALPVPLRPFASNPPRRPRMAPFEGVDLCRLDVCFGEKLLNLRNRELPFPRKVYAPVAALIGELLGLRVTHLSILPLICEPLRRPRFDPCGDSSMRGNAAVNHSSRAGRTEDRQ